MMILLSVSGFQHGPHFDAWDLARLAAIFVGILLALCLGFGAALCCLVASFTRGASYRKSSLIGMGVSTCAGVAIAVFTVHAPVYPIYAAIVLIAIIATIALVRQAATNPDSRQ